MRQGSDNASPSSTPKTGPGHRAPHRDAAQPGARAAEARADRDDRAEGQGAAAVRRADHHHRQARLAGGAENGKALHARRLVLRDIQDREVVSKLFDTIAPRFEARPGGYTRILRLGYRRGDSAEVAQIELVGSEYDPNAESREGRARREGEAEGRRRPAARRGRAAARQEGREEGARKGAPEKKAKPAGQARKTGRTDTRGKGAKTRRRGRRGARSRRFASQVASAAFQAIAAGRSRASAMAVFRILNHQLATDVRGPHTSSAASCPRSAFAAAMILPCRCDGTSS